MNTAPTGLQVLLSPRCRKTTAVGELEIVFNNSGYYISCWSNDKMEYGQAMSKAQAITIFNLFK